jgi:XTP/dITP diphosphohydrolase
MPTLILATRNEGKLRELRPLLAGSGIELETLAGHPEVGEVEETGSTFDDNACLKASHAANVTGCWALGEDSGLVVDALAGAPGVQSARFAGAHGDDEANNERLVRDLEGAVRRSCRYVCALALARPGGEIVTVVRGSCEGTILEQARGEGGFGYDPLFLPAGDTRSMAELSPDEKAAISHRGRATRSMRPLLIRHVAGD